MDGWDTQDIEEIVVGGRRMRVGRRRSRRGPKGWVVLLILAVLAGAGVGGYVWFNRPTGLAAIPNPALVAPGGFRAETKGDKAITIGLEIRNTADIPVTVIGARIVAPAGLTSTALTVIPAGPNYEGFTLGKELPAPTPIVLGTTDTERNAIIAARFTVNCAGLLAEGAETGEQIFVTVQVGDEQREEEITPPVVGDEPWLFGTARLACTEPVPTGTPEPPLPPDTTVEPSAGPSQAP